MGVFKPNPEQAAVEELIEQLSQDLVSRYAAAEDELIREMAKRAYRDVQLQQLADNAPGGMGLTAAQRRRQNRVLAELAAHRATSLRDLQQTAATIVERLRSEDLARRLVHIAATEGEAAAAAQLGLAARIESKAAQIPFIGGGAAISTTTLTGSATQAAGAVVLSLHSRLEAVHERITRYPQDAYQRIVSLTSPSTILGVRTSRQQQAATVQRFLAEGITGFVDKANRRWTIGAYAEMAGRTSVNRAFNDAGTWRMQQAGINLVTVVRGFDSCETCAGWAGKVLSTDGTPAGVVTLPSTTSNQTITVTVAGTVENARAAGWNHPNCRCRLVAYLPGATAVQDATTYDPEAERERARQREIERDIRAAKRREAIAPDEVSAARARAEVRERQAEMREFLQRTGRNRSSYREQLHFADGKGGPARPARDATPKPPRSGPVITVAKSTKLGEDIYAARSAIARVHRIPAGLPHVPIGRMDRSAKAMGSYHPVKSTISIRDTGATVRLTTAHEIGHYLDHRLLGTRATSYESKHPTVAVTRDWLRAVQDTPQVRRLQEILAEASGPLETHVRYLLSPEELWGRSYGQYIAVRSADRAMLADVDHWLADSAPWTSNRQWGSADFAPVADAIDAIFESKGLLK